MISKTNKLKKYLSFSWFLILGAFFAWGLGLGTSFAQTQQKTCPEPGRRIDSLLNVLNTTKQDTTKVNLLYKLCNEYVWVNLDTAIIFGEKAIALADKAGFKKGLAKSLNGCGYAYFYSGNYKKSLEYHERSLKINNERNDKKGIAASLSYLGLVYNEQGDYAKALNYYLRSLKIKEELGDKSNIAMTLHSIGVLYYEQDMYDKAMQYLKKSLKLFEEENKKSDVANLLARIGNVYMAKEINDTALIYYNHSLKLFEEVGNKRGIAILLNNIAGIYNSKKNPEMAIEMYRKAFQIRKELGDKNGMAIILLNLGSVKKDQREFNKAILYLEQSLELSEQIGYLDMVKENYFMLAKTYAAMKNFNKAYEYHTLYVEIKDSIFNSEKSKQIAEMQTKYETEKKEKEIEIKEVQLAKNEIEIKQQKTVKFAFMGGFALVALLAFLVLWSLQRKKRDNRIIAAEKAKSDELLLNILPSETAEELKKYGHSDARPYDIVSVLFTDFEGFSEIAEKLSAEKLVSELDLCFRAFDKLMGKYNVEKIKTIGDSYMCAGGIPVPNITNPIDVVKCGLEIQQFMETYKEERIKKNEPYFELRIGVHTGPIVAGIVGLKKFAYDIWGDTVNIASRIESSGEVRKVNISGATYELVKDNFVCTYRGKIQAKNKGEIDMYFVEGII